MLPSTLFGAKERIYFSTKGRIYFSLYGYFTCTLLPLQQLLINTSFPFSLQYFLANIMHLKSWLRQIIIIQAYSGKSSSFHQVNVFKRLFEACTEFIVGYHFLFLCSSISMFHCLLSSKSSTIIFITVFNSFFEILNSKVKWP